MDKGSDTNSKLVLRSIHDACTRTRVRLQTLSRVNQELDVAYCSKFESESTARLRLGKAHAHIQAACRWEIGPDVLHVLSPDIRAATRILRPVVTEFLASEGEANELNRIHAELRSRYAKLEQFAHPTPFVLTLSRDVGGFDEPVWRLYLAKVHLSLCGILAEYGTALASFAEGIDDEKVCEIIALLNEANSELSTLQSTIKRLESVEDT
ncbi:MAG: hypothetical protein OXH03_11225 [Bacteroidetes bacterium]|nr:hypothetical protein [Bacteroidota bacterium]MDE2671488.1 hypothetical protein [Bacteroidota bacterium]